MPFFGKEQVRPQLTILHQISKCGIWPLVVHQIIISWLAIFVTDGRLFLGESWGNGGRRYVDDSMDTAIRKGGSPCRFPQISPSHVGMVTDSETATPVRLRISC